MNTGFGVIQVSMRHVIEPSDHSVSNHLSPSQRVSGVFFLRWAYRIPAYRDRPLSGSKRLLGFAIP